MRRISRRFFAASLFSLVALLPMTAQASESSLTEYVVGTEYAVGSCLNGGGDSGSFAGYGSRTLGGQANAVFNTTICHGPLSGTASINPGGSFTLVTSTVALAGSYTGGYVGPGTVHRGFFLCKELFPVVASLGHATSPPAGFTNISRGSATGTLTHIGFNTAGGGCQPFAATITGVATLSYPG